MFGYDGWKTASPYDNDAEWEGVFSPTCEAELDYAPKGHTCNDNCDGIEGYHSCGWNGELQVTCVGDDSDYTRYWTCPECDNEYEDEVKDW